MIKHSDPNYKPFPAEIRFHEKLAKAKLLYPKKKFIAPQFGAQTRACLSPAMMILFGGAAGGGKSFAIPYRQMQFIKVPEYSGAIFRRTFSDLRKGSGMLTQTKKIYTQWGKLNETRLEWTFPTGKSTLPAVIGLHHCQHESDAESYRSSAFGEMGFDEATTFTQSMIWELWQRNRDQSGGMEAALFAGTNPDPDSFWRKMIDWWIGEDGFPIQERSGIIRWFLRNPEDDTLEWRDTAIELKIWYKEKFPLEDIIPDPISFTFIPSKLADNPAMLEADPSYGARIAAQAKVWRMRMGGGNWDIKPVEGDYFQRKLVMDTRTGMPLTGLPTDMFRIQDYKFCWGWDLAMTAKREGNDPDYTCGVLMAMSPNNRFYIMDCVMERLNPRGVKELILDCARKYPEYNAVISLPLEAALGAGMTQEIQSHLAGFRVHTSREEAKGREGTMGAKEGRFYPFSSQVFNDGVRIVHSGSAHDWKLERYLMQLEALPFGKHDDAVDATSRAFTYLTSENVGGMVIY